MNEGVIWYLGESDDSFGFSVHVIDLVPNSLIHVRWGDGDDSTEVRWLIEETDEHDTLLTIEESGFAGIEEEIVARVLDSTGGFNQVIVAAKALLEHDVAINVVSDHASTND